MHELQELRRNLVALVEADRSRRWTEEEACARAVREEAATRARFERRASSWMGEALPRLQMLLELLPATGIVERGPSEWQAVVSLPANPGYPVAASLTLTITPVDGDHSARVAIEPLLIPMLQGHPQPAVRDFEIETIADSAVVRFLDAGVLAFARAYLHVRDPESPYQTTRRSRRETEPSRRPAAIEEPAITE